MTLEHLHALAQEIRLRPEFEQPLIEAHQCVRLHVHTVEGREVGGMMAQVSGQSEYGVQMGQSLNVFSPSLDLAVPAR